MGNQQTRESRFPGSSESPGSPSGGTPSQNRLSRHTSASASSNPSRSDRRNRLSRADVFGAFITSGAGAAAMARDQSAGPSTRPEEGGAPEDEPFQRKETKQEREARRREKHATLRLAEREHSLRSESVDGGYLVTLGTYTGTEDFSKSVVRQLQIERKLAPFWKGLENHEEGWSDYQLAAAVRGLPIPDAADQPPSSFFSPSPDSNTPSSPVEAPASHATLSVPGVDNSSNIPPRASSPFRHRGSRALAAALNLGSSKTAPEPIVTTPREMNLPPDLNIDGRPIESVLYRDATECPICFLSYPPFLNHTRCCSQPICSECFVQIKRPDPHVPEHHPGDDPAPTDEETEQGLVSEPSTCPYCQQSELGVTYEPPPFRRGLVYSSPLGDASLSSPTMSSQSSLNSPPPNPVAPGTRRRTYSLSANAPNVVTTDRIRPDWETKLNTARHNRARRAAAATALHTAAFMAHQPSNWGRLALFRHAAAAGPSSSSTRQSPAPVERPAAASGSDEAPVALFSRLEEFENFLVAEGIRQSLASKETEDRKEARRKEKEERKAREKAEKEERKARELKEKEERKALKAQKVVYGGGTAATGGASRSSLSLPFGRKRGNSTASISKSNVQSALPTPGEEEEPGSYQPLDQSQAPSVDKGKAPERPVSHSRHFSTASSLLSGQQPSSTGSVDGGAGAGSASPSSQERQNQVSAATHASALSLSSAADSDGANAGTEAADPLFNYRSLAEGIGMDIDTGRINDTPAAVISDAARAQGVRQEEDIDVSVATLKPQASPDLSQSSTRVESQDVRSLEPPELVVTPGSPAHDDVSDKFNMGPRSHVVEQRAVEE